jgi:cytochrome b subunit of formate dehydrogenase
MLILLGLFHAIAGLAEVVDPDRVRGHRELRVQVLERAWGWIHLIGGIIVFFAGFAIFRGAVWGRTVGVIIAIVSAVAAFAWLPYAPVSAIAIIAIDITVIWALTAHGRDVTA